MGALEIGVDMKAADIWELVLEKAKSFTILLWIIFYAVPLSGCTLSVNGNRAFFYERPAIGLSTSEKDITNVQVQKQTCLSLDTQDGMIRITQWNGDDLQVIENRKVRGPASFKTLQGLLERNRLQVLRTATDIRLWKEREEDQRPLFRVVDDIELMVPSTLKSIQIRADSGTIYTMGISTVTDIELTLDRGNIKVTGCKAYKLIASVSDGDLDVAGFTGIGEFDCGKGNLLLRDVTGPVSLKSVSGDTVIEGAEGKLDCDISTGSITIRASRLNAGTNLYASCGDIDAGLEGMDASGSYTIKASAGSVTLHLADKTGWSMLARSTSGRIIQGPGLLAGGLKKSPTGEVYGDVGGGGPMVDVYTDRGNIYLY